MRKISTVIVTDSTCDMRKEVSLLLEVEVVPLTVTFGNATYNDGFGGIMKKLFFSRLRSESITPITSQPSPDEFLTVFNKHKRLGNEVVYIGISSKSSGTLQAAGIAKDMCNYEHIHIVDSYNLSHGLEVLVRIGCRLRDRGESARQIAEKLKEISPKIHNVSIVDTLKYLVRGGRVRNASPLSDGRLGMKNLVGIINGVFTPISLERGRVGAFEKIYNSLKKHDVNPELPVILTHADNKEHMYQLEHYLKSKGLDLEYIHSEIGAVIGTHMGPGTVGIAYVEK